MTRDLVFGADGAVGTVFVVTADMAMAVATAGTAATRWVEVMVVLAVTEPEAVTAKLNLMASKT